MEKKERFKKTPVKNSTGLDSRMLPRTSKPLAIYKIFEVGEKDPLTEKEILPPPVIIQSTYTLYDKFEEDPNKRLKVMKSISGVEHRLNSKNGEMEPFEIYKDIEFSSGYLTVNTQTQYNTYLFVELHPANISNKFRKDYPNGGGQAVFERVDLQHKGIAEKVGQADLSLDAEIIVRKMDFETIKKHSVAMGISIMDRNSDDIKWNLRIHAKRDPRKFFSSHPEPKHLIKVHILDAMGLGVLLYNSSVRKFKFHDETKAFFTATMGKDAEDELVDHFLSKDGKDDLAELRKLIEE